MAMQPPLLKTLSISRLTAAIERPPTAAITSLWNLFSVNRALSKPSLITSREGTSPWLPQQRLTSETPITQESSWVNSMSTGQWASFTRTPPRELPVMLAVTFGSQIPLKPRLSRLDRMAHSHSASLTLASTDSERLWNPRINGLPLVNPDSSPIPNPKWRTIGPRFRFPSSSPTLERSWSIVYIVLICSRTIR